MGYGGSEWLFSGTELKLKALDGVHIFVGLNFELAFGLFGH
jgi:hypothetical protein